MCDYTGHEFGAHYPDSVCIDGYLWDADSDDGDGMTSGGEWACPRCNTVEFLADAAMEAGDGSCGHSMGRPWCGADQFERAVAKARSENPQKAEAFIAIMDPFEASDWRDREAVYAGRARWDDTITVTITRDTIRAKDTHHAR